MNNGTYKITLLGDSIAKGVIYDESKDKYIIAKESFSGILEQKLKGAIHNAGKFGSTIVKGSKKLYDDLTKSLPDIVFIEFGGNDCDFHWEDVAQNPEEEHYPNTELTVFKETLRNIVLNLKSKNVVPILMTLPPLDADNYFKWISRKSENYAENIAKWLGNINRIYSWHESYSLSIMELAKETDTNLIDVRSAFLESENYKAYLCVDGIHPNLNGHKLIAEMIIDYIKSNYTFLLKEV
jgi:lysophospholipase L1-like esterase